MSKQFPKEIKIIQTLRGISALGVLFCHLWHNQENIIIHPILNQLSKTGAYGVQVFFIISGFILPYSLKDKHYKTNAFLKFMARRLIRLEPAYLVSILLALFLGNYLALVLETPFTMPVKSKQDLLLHLLYLVPFVRGASWTQGVNWTLAIEFQFYIILGLLMPTFINTAVKKWIKHGLLLTLVLTGFIYAEQTFLFKWLSFFCAGISLFLYLNKTFSTKDVMLQFTIYIIANWLLFQSPYFLIIMAGIPILINALLHKQNMPFQFLGKISYSIYLVHGLVGIFVTNYLSKIYPTPSTIQQIGILLSSTLTSIFISWIFYQLFEKPFTRISKQIKIK